jgi:diguanylate cyclase (GGDEF)-like protein
MAFGSYLLAYLLLGFTWALGLLSGKVYLWFILATFLIHLIYYAVFRSGWNRRLRDPSMTMIQMVVSCGVIIVMMYFSDQVRWAFLMMFLVVFLFGIFHLRTVEFLAVGLFVMIGYAALIGLLIRLKPHIHVRIELLQWVVLAGMLPWFAVMGGYISRMRQRLQESLQTIHEMAIHDELTGLYNRRYLMETLAREKARCDRGEEVFSLCMLDLDYFKKVNDTLGHLGGDEVLKTFARLVASGLRSGDCFARFGGEEFVLVLPQTRLDGACHVAEQVRWRISRESYPSETGAPVGITVSVGVAEYRAREDLSKTLTRADIALYRAKQRGRNRVMAVPSEKGHL